MAKRRPNIIVCQCDQLRAFELGCYGNDVIRTPQLDALAERGVRFEVACSNNPVCTPARATLLTGEYSRTCNGMTGCCGNPGPGRGRMADTTLAEVFRAAGYRTATIGKWHLPVWPDRLGFEHFVIPDVPHRHRQRRFFVDGDEACVAEGWSWDYEMRRLREWVAHHDDEPMFVYFNVEPPHMPLVDAPDHYTCMYRPADMPLRPNVYDEHGQPAYDAHWFRGYRWDHRYLKHEEPGTEWLPEGFGLRDLYALYYGLTTLVDDQVGKLVELLKTHGLLDDTLLLFVSDHGDNLGSHGTWNKMQIYEESIRVPMIWHWPDGLAPRVVEEQVASLVDVMPTALGLVGVERPNTAQGTDLADVVRGSRATAGENAAYIEVIDGTVGVRTDRYTYGIGIADPSLYHHAPENDRIIDEQRCFFDNQHDPYQQHNLAGTRVQAAVADDLRRRVIDWHQRTPWHDQNVAGAPQA